MHPSLWRASQLARSRGRVVETGYPALSTELPGGGWPVGALVDPHTFYDLVIEVAIVRPGPIQGGAVHPYLQRRQDFEPVTYPSDALKTALGRTLGVPIFQEQVMQVAILAAGFTAGEADRLRRAMAAWKRKGGLENYYDRIINGMLERGYDQIFAEGIFEQIKGFGEYGFPESHAASFALLVLAEVP
ncbi:DNA polymerase III alpha subunit [Paraburkholderia sp. 40]